MAQSLKGACQRLQAIARGLDGVAFAPATLISDGSLTFPYVESYPLEGSMRLYPGQWFTELHTIRTRIHICRYDLNVDVQKAADLIPAFIAALHNDTNLGGTVDTIIPSEDGVTYSTGGVQYPTTTTYAVTFHIKVKIKEPEL